MSDKRDLVKNSESDLEKREYFEDIVAMVDVYENENEILLYADMPGVLKEDVSINIDNGKLSLAGVRRIKREGAASWEEFGNVQYQRTFSVPQAINVDTIHAELKLGVLKLHLPKSETAKPRKIEIKDS